MSFEYTKAVEFVAATAAANAAAADSGVFPKDTIAAFKESGLAGLVSATAVGGKGESLAAAAVVVERLARECASTAMIVCMHYCATATIEAHGPEDVRKAIAAGRGAIVNTTSGRALTGAARGAHYAASKGGILSFTKSLALDWAPHGIRVNCVIPGVIETALPLLDAPLDELRARGARFPMGRLGQPEDIAGVVAFLLGPDAGYMTGQAIAVNGGEILLP